MEDLVHSITCLCKLLNLLTDITLKVDYFRLAKLNQLPSEEVALFWKILHKFCCSSSSCLIASNQCVAEYLMSQNEMVAYSLPPEASARQLLLCFTWFLSQGIIEKVIDKIINDSALREELPIKTEYSEASEVSSRQDILERDSKAQLNYAFYLHAQIQHNMIAIRNYCEERAQLTNKIHKLTTGFRGLPHLSAGDVELLADSQVTPTVLAKCQHVLRTLQIYSKWQKKSSVFWLWAGTVLNEEESTNLNMNISTNQLQHLDNFLKKVEDNVKKKVRLGQAYEVDNFPTIVKDRVLFNEKSESLVFAITEINDKVLLLSKENDKKKEMLLKHISSCEEIGDNTNQINLILDGFSRKFLKKSKLPTSLSPPNIGALALGNSSSDLTVNKVILD